VFALRLAHEVADARSHNLSDVFAVADRVVVLRLGRNAGSYPAQRSAHQDIVTAITGAATPLSEAPA